MDVLFLSGQEVAGLLSIEEVMEAVELSFKESALGFAQMPPKIYLNYTKYNGDLRAMPAYLERLDVSAVKIVNAHPDNMKNFGLPTVMATILLVAPKNGQLLAIMDGRHITAMRTGATGGIAAKYLAKKDPQIVSFIGAGVQARTQLQALLAVFQTLKEIRTWDVSQLATEMFLAEAKAKTPQLDTVSAKTIKDAVESTDIIVTTTPSTKPLIMDQWISDGMHLNCIGADAPGKEEIDPQILKRSKIIVDDWNQASHSGEINVPLSNGVLSKEDIWAEMGEVIAGIKPGRTTQNEITVFDSTGLSIQDAITANLVYQKALNQKIGHYINL